MPFRIAIASGKGGTGKTTVSINLFHYIKKFLNASIELVDCDVEEPNDLLFFPNLPQNFSYKIDRDIYQIDINKCKFDQKCKEYCEFSAITMFPNIPFAEINHNLCHSCGACSYVCGSGAIQTLQEEIGIVEQFQIDKKSTLLHGELKVGSAMQTLLIRELKKYTNKLTDFTLFDAPPGTSCSVVQTICDADYVILVTEPTPFGLHDMQLTINLLQEIQKPFGIIINKAYHNNFNINDYITANGFKLLGKIPFSKSYASKYANGKIISNETFCEMRVYYFEIVTKLKDIINEGNYNIKW